MSKYYLIKVDETSDVININKNNQLCLETWNNEYGDSIEIIRNSDSFIELTKEDIENCLEGVEHFQDRNMEVPDTFNKIRKVLE